MDQLNTAITLATLMHQGQSDKAGQPYILHPLRLVAKTKDRKEQIVALLHDIIEDSEVTEQDLRAYKFDNDIVEAVFALTHIESENYEDYITRISKSQLAARVKLLDLSDNMDLTRLNGVTKADLERHSKYGKAYLALKLAVGDLHWSV